MIIESRKILVLGRAASGKSTIQKIIFEGESPEDLLENPLEPTRGISPSVHSWLDLKLGVFDSSGQELENLLQDEEEQKIAFENSDTIIYLLDFPRWCEESEDIMKEIERIKEIIINNQVKTSLVLIFHKIDLIPENRKENVIDNVRQKIEEGLELSIFFTSILPDLIYSVYNAFYIILSSYSEDNSYLKALLDESIGSFSKTMGFITNVHDSIIAQSMTKDFNTIIINHSHKLIAQIKNNFADMVENDDIDNFIIRSKKKLQIILFDLGLSKFNVKNLIYITEEESSYKLIKLMGRARIQLSNFFYVEKKKGIKRKLDKE